MDYTDDSCMNIFTQDQKERMIVIMNNAPRRASLLTSMACQPVAATDSFKLQGINLYPNPATTVINIKVTGNDLPDSYTIYNSLWQTVAAAKIANNANLAINTAAYSNGIYFVKIDKGNQSKTLKFIKN